MSTLEKGSFCSSPCRIKKVPDTHPLCGLCLPITSVSPGTRGTPTTHPPTPMNPEHFLDSDSRQPWAPLASHCLCEPLFPHPQNGSKYPQGSRLEKISQHGNTPPTHLSPRGLLSYYIITVSILLIAVIISSHLRIYLLTPGGQPDNYVKVKVLVAQSCTLCDPMNCSPPGSSAHGILQARKLEWVAISFSRGSS